MIHVHVYVQKARERGENSKGWVGGHVLGWFSLLGEYTYHDSHMHLVYLNLQ